MREGVGYRAALLGITIQRTVQPLGRQAVGQCLRTRPVVDAGHAVAGAQVGIRRLDQAEFGTHEVFEMVRAGARRWSVEELPVRRLIPRPRYKHRRPLSAYLAANVTKQPKLII